MILAVPTLTGTTLSWTRLWKILGKGKSFEISNNSFIFEHRAVFIHVAIPGQEPGPSDLANEFKFPKMKELGLNLVSILDNLMVSGVVGLGNGARANIITRYGASPCLDCYLITTGLV
jgi:hypothetical protein